MQVRFKNGTTSRSFIRRVWASFVVGISIQAPMSAAAQSPADTSLSDLVVAGGILAIHGHSAQPRHIFLTNLSRGLVVDSITPRGGPALDTLNAAGLFIHGGNPMYVQESLRPGRMPWLILRTGQSQGDPALYTIYSDVRDLPPDENHPPGPVDERVGCYNVVRAAWDDPESAAGFVGLHVPAGVRLHWQYSLHLGLEKVLVATDLDGELPGSRIARGGWTIQSADSLGIYFSTAYESVIMTLGRDSSNWVGSVRLTGDTNPGPRAAARIELRPTTCR